MLRQDPAAGTEADPGALVALVVARAIPTVDVPDLIGQSGTVAADTLTAAGLEPRTSLQDTTDPSRRTASWSTRRPASGRRSSRARPVRIFVGRLVQAPTTPTTPTPPVEETGE